MKSLLSILHIGRQNRVAVQGSTGFPWDLQKSVKCEIHLSLMNFCEITCLSYCVWLGIRKQGSKRHHQGSNFNQMNARSGLVNADENWQLVFCTLLLMNHLIRKFLSVPISFMWGPRLQECLRKWGKLCFYKSTDILSSKWVVHLFFSLCFSLQQMRCVYSP